MAKMKKKCCKNCVNWSELYNGFKALYDSPQMCVIDRSDDDSDNPEGCIKWTEHNHTCELFVSKESIGSRSKRDE